MSSETNNNLFRKDKEMLSSLENFVNRTTEAFELLEVISDKSGNAIDFKFLKVNSAFEKQTGLRAENIIGKLKKEHAPAPELWYDIAINAVKTGKTLNYEYYNDKINRYCETLFTPISANQIAVTFKDTTERKIAEIKLRDSERKYRALVDATNTGYLIIDKQGKVIDANEEYVRLSGHGELGEIIGRSVMEWTADFDREKNRGAVDRCLKNGFINGLIIHYIGNSGIVPLEINAAVADLGSSVQIVSLCRDISEREKAETKLKDSEEKFKALVERLPEMVLEIDKSGKVIFANSRVIEITGYSKEELESNFEANRFVAAEDTERSRQNMKLSFSGEMRHSNEYTFVKKDGTRFPVLLNSVPIIKNGEIVGARGIIIDLTELKKLQNQLKENERLAAIGATAGWVGHDIRNPLQAMLSDAYLLNDYFASLPDSPTKKEAIESLRGFESNIGYINKIVADLQDYSRPLKPELINVIYMS
jgi:PAS domain S-box-containing protein